MKAEPQPLTDPPREPRSGGVPATRKRLLEAAERLFSDPGYHRVQVADITAAAGTGIGTFYRYFGEKEEILRTLIEEFLGGIRRRIAALREGIEHMPPERQIAVVRDTFATIIGSLRDRPHLAVIIFRTGYGISERINALIWRFITLMTGDIVDDLSRAEQAGILHVPAKTALATAIAGTTLHTAHALVIDGELDFDEAVETCMRFTIGGLSAFATDSFFAATTEVFRRLLGEGEEEEDHRS